MCGGSRVGIGRLMVLVVPSLIKIAKCNVLRCCLGVCRGSAKGDLASACKFCKTLDFIRCFVSVVTVLIVAAVFRG